ncbi:MAG: lipoprotein insertase outer membrane protein LolB [Halieaceae bacterium]
MITRASSVIILCGLLLAGCASQPSDVTPDLPWEQRRTVLATLENWKINGKLALRRADFAESANMVWVQEGEVAFVNLTGPWGIAATRLRTDGSTLEVEQGEERAVYDISTPEAAANSTGWDLPVHSLSTWVLGIPHDDKRAGEMQIENDLVQAFSEDGWQIQYERYEQFGLYTLPTRMRIENEELRATIIMYDWSVSQHR